MRKKILAMICAGALAISGLSGYVLAEVVSVAEEIVEEDGTDSASAADSKDGTISPSSADSEEGTITASTTESGEGTLSAPNEEAEESDLEDSDSEELLEGEGLLSRPEGYKDDDASEDAELEVYTEADSSKIDGNEVVKYIYKSLRDYFGFNHAAACAVVANARHESNFNYTVVGDGGTSYGIFQWHAGRWNNLKAWCGENDYDWQNADGQMAYFRYELEHGYKDVLDYLYALEDSDVGAFDGAYYMCVHFEKPADTYGQANARGKEAIEFFGMEELRNSYRESIAENDDSKNVWDLSNY